MKGENKMIYMQFTAEDGDQFFIGKNKSALLLDTNHGQEFGGEKFINYKDLTLNDVVHYENYQAGASAICVGFPSFLIAIIPA